LHDYYFLVLIKFLLN